VPQANLALSPFTLDVSQQILVQVPETVLGLVPAAPTASIIAATDDLTSRITVIAAHSRAGTVPASIRDDCGVIPASNRTFTVVDD
jgi:hypothetical protein